MSGVDEGYQDGMIAKNCRTCFYEATFILLAKQLQQSCVNFWGLGTTSPIWLEHG
jgi:hypothetical protein